jgi:hypothetical protein
MFPYYRKSKDSKNYFKILSDREFVQLKILGSKIKKYHYKIDKYPEIVLVNDLINTNTEYYQEISEIEFSILYKKCLLAE